MKPPPILSLLGNITLLLESPIVTLFKLSYLPLAF